MFELLDGRSQLYQWDTNVRISVHENIKYVQFMQKFSKESLLVEVVHDKETSYVTIPNILLQSSYDIRLFGIKDDELCTTCEGVLEIHARRKPPNYIYTETETITFKTLEENLKKYVDETVEQGGLTEEEVREIVEETALPINTPIVENIGSSVAEQVLTIELKDKNGNVIATSEVTLPSGGGDIDLSGYVKNTDYAKATVAGVGKVSGGYGTGCLSSGYFYLVKATNAEIDEKNQQYTPIVPSNLDYAVKVGLTTNTETLTDEEKASAVGWLGAVPYPSKIASQYLDCILIRKSTGEWHAVTVDAGDGLAINSQGRMVISQASDAQITSRTKKPLTADKLDYALREAMTNPKLEWTEEQKAAARALLGIE